jgi:hypothetical protein
MLDCSRWGERDNYIPGGKLAYYVANLRPIPEGEYARCGTEVAHDIQSGTIYCGGKATVMADSCTRDRVVDGHVFVCDRHVDSLLCMVKAEERRRHEIDMPLVDDSIEGA